MPTTRHPVHFAQVVVRVHSANTATSAVEAAAAMFAEAGQALVQRLAAPRHSHSRGATAVKNSYPGAKTAIKSLVARVAHRLLM